MPVLDSYSLKVLAVVLIALFVARYKKLFLNFIFKIFFKKLPQNIKEVLVTKNQPAYFLILLSVVCALGFQVIGVKPSWELFLIHPIKFIFVIGLLLFVWGLIDILVNLISDRFNDSPSDSITKNILPYSKKILKVFVGIIIVLIFLQNIGFNVNSLLASLGIGGVALALASKESLSHFFGGISIILDKPFLMGDWIVCDDIEGVVIDIGFRSTKIKTFYDSIITVPNSKLSDSIIDNLGKRKARRTRIQLDITYDTQPEKIKAFIEGVKNIIQSNPCTQKDYYQCYFNSFGSYSLQILLNFFLKVNDWDSELKEKQNIFLEILRLAQELELDFAFPTQTLDMPKPKDPSKTKLSGKDLEKKLEKFKTSN